MGRAWIMSNIFRTTNRGRILENFTITRQKTCCASESNTSVRDVFANRSGFDAPIGVVLAWEERGSCPNILDDKSRLDLRKLRKLRGKRLVAQVSQNVGKRLVAQVSQTRRFALYSRTRVVLMLRLESSWHGSSVDHVLTYSRRQIAVGSQKSSRITRQKLVAQVSQTRRFALYSRIVVVLMLRLESSWHGRSVDHVLTYSRRQIAVGSQKPSQIMRQRLDAQVTQTRRFALYSRTRVVLMLRLESSWHGRSVDHVLTYSGLQIVVVSQKPSRITRQKTCCASESNTSVGVVFANRSGFDAPIGVVLAWEERGSCLNIFRTTNRGRISETFTNYEAKDLLRKSVDHVLTYSGRQIAVVSQKPSQIMRQKTCCASESNTSVCVVFANRSGFDAPIGVFWHVRSVDLVLTYSGRKIAVGSQKPSRITRQKTCCASESNTSVRVVFANWSGFDAPLESSWHGRSVDNVLTYSGRKIAVGSQKPSRITRQKTCCASESNTSVRVVCEPEWF
ncbi:uncharacterized protein G2W53_009849 [Senna tora]|uniref:Uncharacterized protein n=1 Tax=Senna tora TaxID=362788 RepID=A0A835CAK4_9FABA|nr:uncharacterized protein G2W53_009849 [Senna tora]